MANPTQKRIELGIVLTTIVACAFLLAGGVAQWLGAKWLPLDPTNANANHPMRVTRTQVIANRDATPILTRNMFNSSQGDLTIIASDADGSAGTVEWDPNQPAPKCEGATLRLLGSIVNPDLPDWSFVALAGSDGKSRLYRTDSDYDGGKVLAIGAARALVQPSGQRPCELTMFADPEAPDDVSRGPLTTPTPGDATGAVAESTNVDDARTQRDIDRNGGLTPEELDAGIRKISETKYSIQRDLVDKLLTNQTGLMRTARVIPKQENGRVVGVKVYGIRSNSLLGRLGLQNGDMLHTINGFDMTSPDSALEAYARLRTSNNLSVSVTRRGTPTSLEYSVQ